MNLSKQVYYGIILVWTTATLLLVAYIATNFDAVEVSLANLGIYIVVQIVASCIIGAALKRQSIMLMTIGWVASIVPVGLVMATVLSLVEIPDITNTMVVACALTLSSGLVGMFLPWKMDRWSAWVIIGLIVLTILQLCVAYFELFGARALQVEDLLNHGLIMLFCVLMALEFSDAARRPRTITNAMYTGELTALVIVNLFERLLDPTKSSK